MVPHFVLFEHEVGYGLFRLQEFVKIATFLPQVEESFTGDPLANIKSVSEGIFPEDLELFRETNMPKVRAVLSLKSLTKNDIFSGRQRSSPGSI